MRILNISDFPLTEAQLVVGLNNNRIRTTFNTILQTVASIGTVSAYELIRYRTLDCNNRFFIIDDPFDEAEFVECCIQYERMSIFNYFTRNLFDAKANMDFEKAFLIRKSRSFRDQLNNGQVIPSERVFFERELDKIDTMISNLEEQIPFINQEVANIVNAITKMNKQHFIDAMIANIGGRF
jgi:hypothetical protein